MAVLKKIVNIVLTVLLIAVFLISVVAVIASIEQRKTGVAGAFGYSVASVESPSMEPTINVGDVIIGKIVNADTVINENDIVTYRTYIQNVPTTITHRVTRVMDTGLDKYYETWGDNRETNPVPDDGYRAIDEIVSVYVGKISGLGKFITFLREPIGFILVLVLPLTMFVLYEVFSLFRIYFKVKKEELAEETGPAGKPAEATDEMKEAIIQEYLRQQAAAAAAKQDGGAQSPPAATPGEEGVSDKTDATGKPE